jgi:hypothetical protein
MRSLNVIGAYNQAHRGKMIRIALATIFLALALGLSVAPAVAQGCAMCYATAKATPKEGQIALNRAILVMIFPPIGAMTLGIGAAIRYSKKRDEEKESRD